MQGINIKKHIKGKALHYLTGIVMIAAFNLIAVWIPQITAQIIDGASEATLDSHGILLLCLKILGVAGVSFVLAFLSRYFIFNAALLFGRESRNKVFEYLVNLSMKYFSKNSVGDVMALTTNDLRVVENSLRMVIMGGARVLLLIALSFVAMSSVVDPVLTLIVFAPFPVLSAVMVFFRQDNKEKVQESPGQLFRPYEKNRRQHSKHEGDKSFLPGRRGGNGLRGLQSG